MRRQPNYFNTRSNVERTLELTKKFKIRPHNGVLALVRGRILVTLTFLHLFDLLVLVLDGSPEQSEDDTGLGVHPHRRHQHLS